MQNRSLNVNTCQNFHTFNFMENISFPVSLRLRIDWSEIDVFGHVNNVMFMKYVQASRVNYWETIGLESNVMPKGIGPMLASTACQFKKPLFYPGSVTIHARIEFMKNTSFGVSHQLYNDKSELVAEAQDVVVLYDFSKNEKVLIPDWLREKIESLEKRKF